MTNTRLEMNAISEPYDNLQTLGYPNSAASEQQNGMIRTLPNEQQETFFASGVLDIIDEGFGVLRGERYLPSSQDIYVSASLIRRFALRQGDLIEGQARPRRERDPYPGLIRVDLSLIHI